MIGYEWDPDKAQQNLIKHRIDFADAVGVFQDGYALTINDPKNHTEERFITLGIDFLGRLLTVVYTYRQNNIRIISARLATKNEKETYIKRKRWHA